MIYALWVDEIPSDGRHQAREALDEWLAAPLDRREAEQHRRERWGMTGEDLRDRQKSAAFWGDQ